MKRFLISFVSLAVISCTNDSDHKMALNLQPVPHPLVDNLFITEPSNGGGLAPMGGAVGRFFLVGRCILVKTDDVPRTPVFRAQANVTRSGLVTAGQGISYGRPVSLPMIGPPMRIPSLRGGKCPEEALIVRSVGP